MASAVLGGDASFQERLANKGADIEIDIKKVDEVDQRLDGALHVGKKWAALSASSRDLLTKSRDLSVDQSFEQHTKVIADTMTLIGAVGDMSNLTLDPDLDSYYLMSVVVFQGPELSETLAQARGLGSAIAAGESGTTEQFARLHELSILARFLSKKLDDSLDKALNFNATLKPTTEAYTRTGAGMVRDAASRVAKVATDRKVDTNAADYYSAMSRSVDAVFEVDEQAADSLNGLLGARVDRFRREVLSMLAWVVLGLLVVTLVGFLIMRDITVTLGRVVGTANRIATGDLTVARHESRKDEIGVLARAFDRMVRR